jgi:glycosyltransferase involved in cell wall biosynthesis
MSAIQPLVINLAFVGKKPTGLATYAINLIPKLNLPETVLLASASFKPRLPAHAAYHQVPANLTYEQGKLGHLRRMIWTQTQLPKICEQLQTRLLFSPVPETPLGLHCPSVVMVHDLIPLRFPRLTSPLTQYFRFYVPQVLKQARHILCNSEATAQDLVNFFQVPAAQITAIPLAHDAEHFQVLPLVREKPPDRPYFLYVGRHDPYKNLARLIQAFAALPRSQPGADYELWIAGAADPRFTPTLQTQAAALGIAERVKFLDYVTYDQLPVLLNRAAAMVYPSLWEGFGFPVLEAMACGTPVITSNLSSLPEVAGDAALLVNPYHETEITAAMQQIITDPELCSQMHSAGLARAQQFDWARTAEATAAVLQGL